MLATIARRQRLRVAFKDTAAVWVGGTLSIATAGLLGFLGIQGLSLAFFVLAGAAFVFYVLSRIGLAQVRHADDPERGAAIVDREQVLDDTLKSALEAPAKVHAKESREAQFRAFLEQSANAAAASLAPKQLVPLHISAAFPLGLLLLATSVFFFTQTEEFSFAPAEFEDVAAFEPELESDELDADQAALAEEFALTPEEVLQLTPEQLAQLKLRRGEAGDLSELEIETMSQEELSKLLQELGSGGSAESVEAGEGVEPGEGEGSSEDPEEGSQSAGDNQGLEELQRQAGEDPFAPPPGGEQAQQGEKSDGNSLAPGDEASSSDQVQKIELPPMANPNAKQAEGGEPSSAVAMAGAEASQEMAIPPDASQSGAGGGESSGPQGSETNPLGEITEIAVTLELALLEAEQEAERPVERSIRHRASEAQEAKVRRRGISGVNESANDETLAPRVLSASEVGRMQRYFDPKQWPKEPPSSP